MEVYFENEPIFEKANENDIIHLWANHWDNVVCDIRGDVFCCKDILNVTCPDCLAKFAEKAGSK